MLLPTLLGWLVLRLLENEAPVLGTWERWCMAHVLGITLTMFLFFIAEISGFLFFTALNFLFVCIVTGIALGMLYIRMRVQWSVAALPAVSRKPLLPWQKIVVTLLVVWTVCKVFVTASLLIGSPPYYDDVYNNWNMRGKIFYETQALHLHMETDETTSAGGVHSYPPTVPLVKTWLATLAGEWDEGLVNAPHIVWYMCVLLLVFFFLRRNLGVWWGCIGAYGLSSLPIYTMHGSTAYADIFVSLHVCIAITALYNALRAKEDIHTLSWLRISGLAAALLIFTKNEALLLHVPAYILLLFASVYWLQKTAVLSAQEVRRTLVYISIVIGCILLPWLLFKWANSLTFGNAKPIIGTTFAWQPGVARAIWLNTFFQGNWILFFPLLFGLLLYKWRTAFLSPLVCFTAYFFLLLTVQLGLYFFTGLSTEALRQTGIARGFVQMAPLLVLLATHLLYSAVVKKPPYIPTS